MKLYKNNKFHSTTILNDSIEKKCGKYISFNLLNLIKIKHIFQFLLSDGLG
jgi:hypothetical protein